MQTIAVFKSKALGQCPLDAERVQEGEPLGKAWASRIADKLASRGLGIRGPIAGELSWFVYPTVTNRRYQLSIHWATPLDADEDYWVVEATPDAGMLRRLFSRREEGYEMESLLNILRDLLLDECRCGDIDNLAWMSEEEYLGQYAS